VRTDPGGHRPAAAASAQAHTQTQKAAEKAVIGDGQCALVHMRRPPHGKAKLPAWQRSSSDRPDLDQRDHASASVCVGVSDARAGRPYRDAYQTWHVNAQWGYERGRQWATLVPSSVTLKRDGKVTAEAADWGQRVFEDMSA
jgi:hypothetical protein